MSDKGAKYREKQFSIDLDEIFANHAWKTYLEDKNFVHKLFYRKSQYYADVRWGYVSFKHKTTKFEVRPDTLSDDSTATQKPNQEKPKVENGETHDSTTNQTSDEKEQEVENEVTVDSSSAETPEKEKPKVEKDVTLYMSEYENRTQSQQEHSFNTSRTTTASTSVEFQESYTKGGECNIEISVPGDIVTVGAGLSGELSVTKTEGETFETSISWGSDTNIKVEKGHVTVAKMKVSERTSIADFEVVTTLSILDGKDLPVAIRRVSDDKVVGVVIIPDLQDVFWGMEKVNKDISYVQHNDKSRKPVRVRHDVVLVSRGVCKSTSWRNQRTEVTSKRIPDFVIEETKKEED